MRTIIEWNEPADTESIDNHKCKCALGINHKSGRLQWCPGCGYYKIAILIPLTMIPVIFVFFLLTKLDGLSMNSDQSSSEHQNTQKLFNENILSHRLSHHRHDYNQDDNELIDKHAQKCIAVKYGMSETIDVEERHILKDIRTSFIPPDLIIIPSKCTTVSHHHHSNSNDNLNDITDDLEVNIENDNDDIVHDVLYRSRRGKSLEDENFSLKNNNENSSGDNGDSEFDDGGNDDDDNDNNNEDPSEGNLSYNSKFEMTLPQISMKIDLNKDEIEHKSLHTDTQTSSSSPPPSSSFHFFWQNEESPESIRSAQADIMNKYMDTTIDPCVDFYQFACGNWAKLNPIPKDKAGYDTFEILRESLDVVLKDLLTGRTKRNLNYGNRIMPISVYDDEDSFQQNTNEMYSSQANKNNLRTIFEAARLRRKIVEKRDVLMDVLKKYKMLKLISRKRRNSSNNIFRIMKRREGESTTDDEIDAETKAKYLYQSCMNDELLEKRGIQPLLDLLETFGGWPVLNPKWNEDNFDWLNITGHLRLYNNDIFIVEWVGPDIKNSDENVIQLDQTSLGLPTRDYFLHESNTKYLSAYEVFMESVMNLLGASTEISSSTAKELIEFETELARITSPSEDRSNVSVLYKRMSIEELQSQVPGIDWQRYLSIVQQRPVNSLETIVIYAVDYMKKLVVLLSKTDKRTISNYLLWRFVRHRINNLDDRFKESKQKFIHVLFGREESPPRWKNCVGQVNSNMGMAVGAMFVRKYFDENSKEDTLKMTYELQEAFREILNNTEWLDPVTKQLAELKVNSMSLKIGYPDFILSKEELNKKYTGLYIHPEKYFENTLNVLRHVTQTEQSKLSEAVNKTIWQTAPAIVNAYYSRNKNQIMFPAGILQPPFYHRHFPRSLNYGGIGVVIGHELTHGFDDKGRLFDRNGNIHKWWTDSAINGFHERAKCLISQYGNYTVSEVGIAVDGESTQGENIADNGGIRQAFRAYENWLERYQSPELIESETLPGLNLTNKQLFFLNFAQIWCGAMRPEATRNKLKTAVHSPGKFRVIGTLSNSVDFAKEFMCPVGSPMNPSQKCSVW